MPAKTNAQYLRHILDTLGNLMGPNNYKESIVWLDAIDKELSDATNKVVALTDRVETLEKELSESEDDLVDAKTSLEEMKDSEELSETIDTGLISASGQGELNWHCDNIAIQSLMETFGDKLKKHGHLKIETHLSALL